MLFNSLNYFLFLPLVFVLYWATRGTTRKFILCLASYVFYMSWMPVYGILIFAMTAFNYFAGLFIERNRKNDFLFYFVICANLAALAYYKYTAFFIATVFDALRQVAHFVPSLQVQQTPVVEIVLPLGISFFTFEFIHYIVDVRKGDRPLRNGLDFTLFAAFFPSQLAGPIKRFQQFSIQLDEEKALKPEDTVAGLALISQGLFKKIALADNLAPITAQGISNVHQLGTLDAWLMMTAFLLQIYFDFSGYTDIGTGSARLLGFHLPVNFNLPWIASKNFVDFWRRWHISLSSWLRDYVFIPLGGSRRGQFINYRNILVTFGLSGLWHGAAWQFVIWGFIHGFLIIATHEQEKLIQKVRFLQKIHEHRLAIPLACAGTFVVSLFAWTFFFAHSASDALTVVHSMIIPANGESNLAEKLLQSPFLVSFTMYSVYGLLFVDVPWSNWSDRTRAIRAAFEQQPARQLACIACAFIAAIAFSPALTVPFIYFQF